ncbi:response regulator [Piscinibacter sp. XHJ-5]|uniref:response regulator transcription factor n=1 Tax=Piscinibacter sp. XHJ-5 TaxID=3037797 RepID=UPI002452FE4A|nr:response regulator [Piscinibacter sp. XHJ-5]
MLSIDNPITSADIDVAGTFAGITCNSNTNPVVFVVDDDVSVRESLELLIVSAGWRPETFACAQEFLASARRREPSCLVLDITMPGGLDGLEVQRRLAAERPDMPIIFITGHGDVPMTVQAMKAGAYEFLTKPFRNDVMIGAITSALERSRVALDHEIQLNPLRGRYASLSRRERQVMGLVVCGLLNKQVGSELGISEITVKAHRGSLMRKMQAASLPELVTIAARLGILRSFERRSVGSALPAARPCAVSAG